MPFPEEPKGIWCLCLSIAREVAVLSSSVLETHVNRTSPEFQRNTCLVLSNTVQEKKTVNVVVLDADANMRGDLKPGVIAAVTCHGQDSNKVATRVRDRGQRGRLDRERRPEERPPDLTSDRRIEIW